MYRLAGILQGRSCHSTTRIELRLSSSSSTGMLDAVETQYFQFAHAKKLQYSDRDWRSVGGTNSVNVTMPLGTAENCWLYVTNDQSFIYILISFELQEEPQVYRIDVAANAPEKTREKLRQLK